MNADVEDVVVLVHQPHRLLRLAIHQDGLQAGETADAMIDMRNEVAGFQRIEFL